MSSYEYDSFFKVIVLKIDVFMSSIVDERHFVDERQACEYAMTMNDAGYVSVVAVM